MNLVAINNHVIVEVVPKSDNTESGLYVPEIAQGLESFTRGRVITVGPDAGDDLAPGDLIACHDNGGMDMMAMDKIYKCLKYDEIFCKLED